MASAEIGHIPPQAPEVEEAVIGAMMLDKDSVYLAMEALKEKSFYDSRLRLIFSAMSTLFKQRSAIDMMTVAERLRTDGTLEEVGGPARLASLTAKVGSGSKIVISSFWRSTDVASTVEFMTDPDNPSVNGHPFPYPDKIIGVTPILYTVMDGDIDRPATRGEEIDAYLKAHPCDKYVILDDCPEMLRHQWPHQVLVNDEFGLTDADVEKAIIILDASAIK